RGANAHVGRAERYIAAAQLIDARANFLAELNAQVAQIALFVTVDELGHAAGKHHRVNRVGKIEIGREQKIFHLGRERTSFQDLKQRITEHLSKLILFDIGDAAAQSQVWNTGDLGDLERGVFEPVDLAAFVHGDKAGAHFHGASIDDLAALDDGYLA